MEDATITNLIEIGASVLENLRKMNPAEFVAVVRDSRKAGTFCHLCDLAGAKHGASVSSTRALGNLCRAIHGKRGTEYLAAFYAPVSHFLK